MVAAHREHMQCRAGCSSCCSQTFAITEIEAELLREGLAELAPSIAADILDAARRHQPGDPCPVLSTEGLCRLYAHRPRICRKYGIPLWDPERPDQARTCPLNFREVVDLDPTLIIEPQARWAEDWIVLHRDLGLPPQRKQTIARWLGEHRPTDTDDGQAFGRAGRESGRGRTRGP